MDPIEEAFKAGYHCRWHREQGQYCFDPAMSPGDPDGAFEAWQRHKANTVRLDVSNMDKIRDIAEAFAGIPEKASK